jgi:UDP-3-O-[3-hydroxymyristoyl] glucosamine N-acyltransferase
VIEDDVEIGAHTAVQRGTLDPTRIRRNAKIDSLCVVSHNCDVGEDAMLVGQSGLGGSTILERGVIVMGQAGTAGHLRVGARSLLAARAGVSKNLAPGSRVWGTPAWEDRRWHRSMAALGRLPDVLRRLREVERRLGLRRRRDDGGSGA